MNLRQVIYEQYWPWELVHEQEIDFAGIVRGDADQVHPEIAWLIDQGYQPTVGVSEQIAQNYTMVTYEFWLRPQDITVLLIKFPKAAISYEV